MVQEASLECRLRKIDETKNYLLEEINHNDLMSKNYEKTCKYLNYVEHLVILASTVAGCFINKRKKNHDKVVLLGKDKLNTTEVLISKALISSYISHDEFVSVNNVF